MKRIPPQSVSREREGLISRRGALTLLWGSSAALCRSLSATEPSAPVRMAMSENLIADVNVNDARAAMQIWIKRVAREYQVFLEISPRVFDTTEEIVRRVRAGDVDSVAVTVVEYRQIAEFIDPKTIMNSSGSSGIEQYVLLVKRGSGIQHLSELRGHKLCGLANPKMCVASAWLASILDEAHLGKAEQFFGAMATETKVSRVVLPVFFGQTDACLTTKRGFDGICELNPQVGKDLAILATSPELVVTFYAYRKNYHGDISERITKVYADLANSPSGRQLSTLFQFEGLQVRDTSCLTSALTILEKAERIEKADRVRPGGGVH